MTSLPRALLVLTLVLGLLPSAQAQSKKKKSAKAQATTESTPNTEGVTQAPTPPVQYSPSEGVRVAPGEVLNFSTDNSRGDKDPAQVGQGYSFKDSSAPMQAPIVYNDAVADDTPFKTYIGYPKNLLKAFLAPQGHAAVWTYNNQDINFRTNTLAMGVGYELQATPRFAMGLDYTHSAMSVSQTQVTNQYQIKTSTTNLDTYFLSARYCFFGSGNFNLQYCPGFTLGNDAYPILTFDDGSHLHLDKVQDIIAGVNFRLQFPVTDRLNLHLIPGFNYGTGMGNSGALTSKSNSTFYGLLGARYEFNTRHSIEIDGTMDMRTAKISGKVGSNTDTWTTKSSVVGGKLTYVLSL